MNVTRVYRSLYETRNIYSVSSEVLVSRSENYPWSKSMILFKKAGKSNRNSSKKQIILYHSYLELDIWVEYMLNMKEKSSIWIKNPYSTSLEEKIFVQFWSRNWNNLANFRKEQRKDFYYHSEFLLWFFNAFLKWS